jgi:tRNA threonylcarbamoyladenosine biosynthesis protein TsaB
MNDKLVLGIETSGILCSVAWWKDNSTLLEYNIEKKNVHATLLPELVKKGFRELNIKPQNICLIAVSIGPGSFTGLRIGMAYAKGLCVGSGIPIKGVSNFEVLADHINEEHYPIFSLIEARNDNFYTGVFNSSKLKMNEKYIAHYSQLNSRVPENGYIVVHEELERGKFSESFDGKATVIEGIYSSKSICSIGYDKYVNKGADRIEHLEPLYLQKFAGVL